MCWVAWKWNFKTRLHKLRMISNLDIIDVIRMICTIYCVCMHHFFTNVLVTDSDNKLAKYCGVKMYHHSYQNIFCLTHYLVVCTTVYPKKYAHGFVVLCFVVVMQSCIMNSHEVFIHIHQGCFAGTGAIVRLPQCQWSKPDGYGKISQCITTTKHSKAKTVCIFLGIYCI